MKIVKKKYIFGEYDFYLNGNLIAQLRRQLMGHDYAYVYFFPKLYGDSDRTRIDLNKYVTNDEVLEKAKTIIRKKLYLMATGILSDMRSVEMDSEK